MGLDMFARSYRTTKVDPWPGLKGLEDFEAQMESATKTHDGYYWRKHSQLHQYMKNLYDAKMAMVSYEAKFGEIPEFNCVSLELEQRDIDHLREKIINGFDKTEGGFFWGHQFQNEQAEHYKPYDLEFCDWATERISVGERVFYTSWW